MSNQSQEMVDAPLLVNTVPFCFLLIGKLLTYSDQNMKSDCMGRGHPETLHLLRVFTTFYCHSYCK